MIVVHGTGEHSGRYDHVGRFLAERGHDITAFDNRGHGQSGGRRGDVEHFEQFLDDVEDLVVERRTLGVPVVLFGHSLGGLIAASYSVADRPPPDLLVLSAPALDAVTPRWQRVAAPVLNRIVPRLFVRSEFDATLLSSDAAVQDAYRRDPLRVRGATARLGHAVFSAMAQTRAQLPRLSIPTYVLQGGDDRLVPPAVTSPLQACPSVTYRLWPGLRHECLNEAGREEVLGEIEAWLTARLGS
jgi:alpha-beta hydrolase superfamily lysophospholipase